MRSSWPAYCIAISACPNPSCQNVSVDFHACVLTTRVWCRLESAAHVADHSLVQAQDVALGVGEPRGLLVAHDAHVVDGLDLRRVVVEEADAATLEVLDLLVDYANRVLACPATSPG